MGSVLLISTQAFDYEELEKTYHDLGTAYRKPGLSDMGQDTHWYPELTIEGDWGWFRFDDYDPIKELYYEILADDGGPEELAKVRALDGKPIFLVLEFSSREAGEVALLRFPDKGVTLIDNEDNMIFSLEEIRQRIRDGREWEYTSNQE